MFRQYISICKLHMMVSVQFSCLVLNPQVPSRAGRVALRFQTGASFARKPSESHGVLFRRVTKNVEKRWLIFSPINDERFMGFLMCFFEHFLYICAVCICFYMFLNMYIIYIYVFFFPP